MVIDARLHLTGLEESLTSVVVMKGERSSWVIGSIATAAQDTLLLVAKEGQGAKLYKAGFPYGR